MDENTNEETCAQCAIDPSHKDTHPDAATGDDTGDKGSDTGGDTADTEGDTSTTEGGDDAGTNEDTAPAV